jgi:hypothetical protein
VLRATTPRRAGAGSVDVVVENPDGQRATLSSAYAYVAPVALAIERLEPSFGPTTGRTAVLVSGQGLDRVTRVMVGERDAVEFKSRGAEALGLIAPPRRSAGLVDVTLSTREGDRVMRPKAFRYDAVKPPAIRSLSPNRGRVDGGSEVTISGEHFAAGSSVSMDGVPVASLKIKNSETLVVTTPAGKAGRMVDVCVTTPDGQRAVAARAFLYDPRYR